MCIRPVQKRRLPVYMVKHTYKSCRWGSQWHSSKTWHCMDPTRESSQFIFRTLPEFTWHVFAWSGAAEGLGWIVGLRLLGMFSLSSLPCMEKINLIKKFLEDHQEDYMYSPAIWDTFLMKVRNPVGVTRKDQHIPFI